MSVEDDLVVGTAQLLAAAGVAQFSLNGNYADGVAAIFDTDPPQRPGPAISISSYPVTEDDLSHSTLGLQFWIRGGSSADTTRQLSAGIYGALQELAGLVVNGVRVIDYRRRFSQAMGTDDHGNYERADTYYVRHLAPTPNRTT